LVRETVQRRKVTVIFYHDPPPEILASHIAALRRHYNLISLREFINAHQLRQIRTLPPKSLVISLDDGHAGNFRLRALLDDEKIRVTIFLCSGIVGTRRRFWFKHAQEDVEHLKHLPDGERVDRLRESGFDDSLDVPKADALSRGEIEQLSPIVDFQSHTVSHPVLPYCSSEKSEWEIVRSRQQLADDYGIDVFALAYPNGDYSDREMLLARRAGYSCAFTAEPGFNSDRTDPFQLKRISIDDNDGVDELLVKASGLWSYVERTFKRKSFGYMRAPASPISTFSRGVPPLGGA
jgi:peptidoglycan/xylan/chitin deacetylase (PgdA/CDA1 family)